MDEIVDPVPSRKPEPSGEADLQSDNALSHLLIQNEFCLIPIT